MIKRLTTIVSTVALVAGAAGVATAQTSAEIHGDPGCAPSPFDGDTVTLTVENHSDRSESPEITDIVSTEPSDLPDDASVVDLDGEWFVSWEPSVPAGESAELTYTIAEDATFDVDVDGVEAEKLTIDAD